MDLNTIGSTVGDLILDPSLLPLQRCQLLLPSSLSVIHLPLYHFPPPSGHPYSITLAGFLPHFLNSGQGDDIKCLGKYSCSPHAPRRQCPRCFYRCENSMTCIVLLYMH
jgi:hypothetical protein